MKLGDEAWHSVSVCPINGTTGFHQIRLLYGNNRKVLKEITDNKDRDKPIHIRNKADPEAEQEITEIQGVTDIPIGTRCDEISGGTECSRTRRCPCISDCPYPEELPRGNEHSTHDYSLPHGFSEIEECEDKRDRCETADFEKEIANFFNFPGTQANGFLCYKKATCVSPTFISACARSGYRQRERRGCSLPNTRETDEVFHLHSILQALRRRVPNR